MAKMKKMRNIVDWKFNITQLVNDQDVCSVLVQIEHKEIHSEKQYIDDKIERDLKQKYDDTFSVESGKKQIGRVWMLIKQNENDEYEVLQVAQALEYTWNVDKGFWYELRKHVNAILSGINCDEYIKDDYAKIGESLKENEILMFYEVQVDKYLDIYAPDNVKEIVFEIAKEYYTEASIAFYTQADWGFYNSGMDKRALYRIYEDYLEIKKIEEQKKKVDIL